MSEVKKLKSIRDRRYKMLLSLITILVLSLFYNPFTGENQDYWLLVIRLVLVVISYFILAFLVKVVVSLESTENKNVGFSSILFGFVYVVLAIIIAVMPIVNNNENIIVILSIFLLFIGIFAVFDGFMIMINYSIKNLRGKRSILEFVLKVIPLLGSITIGLVKVLIS